MQGKVHSRARPAVCSSSFRGSELAGKRVAAAPRRLNTAAGGRRSTPIVNVIPMTQGMATDQTPPDLPSFLFKERIVYLGMSLVPSVTELMLAELLYLQYEDANKPIFLYINSTGTTKNGEKLGYDTEAFAIYDTMLYVKNQIHTLCVGNAWGEAAMLLAAGTKGHRATLPSGTIMLKQPMSRFRGQATDIDNFRKEVRYTKQEMCSILGEHTGKTPEQVEKDISRPLYMSPQQAVDYGVIDRVISEAGKQKQVQ